MLKHRMMTPKTVPAEILARAETKKRRSLLQEKSLAKKLHGRRQPCSGALETMKGDIKTARFLVEAKTTEKRQYTLKLDTLLKLQKEAFGCRKDPVLALQIGGKNYMVIPENLFLELEAFA